MVETFYRREPRNLDSGVNSFSNDPARSSRLVWTCDRSLSLLQQASRGKALASIVLISTTKARFSSLRNPRFPGVIIRGAKDHRTGLWLKPSLEKPAEAGSSFTLPGYPAP